MNEALEIFEDSCKDWLNPDFRMVCLDRDCDFTEGPVFHHSGFYLCSDIPRNLVYRFIPGEKKEIYIECSGTNHPDHPDLDPYQTGSNGLAWMDEKRLLLCRHGAHSIDIFEGGTIRPFISSYKGKPFNSPNDLVLHGDGSIYFTDPPYGLKGAQLNPENYQPLAGVYRWFNGTLDLITHLYTHPNGITLSPDHRQLYIGSHENHEKFISVFDVDKGEVTGVFAAENGDGMKTDRQGHLYLTSEEGILVLNKKGERAARIHLPTEPSNICWGGSSGNDLFITARQNVFLATGIQR